MNPRDSRADVDDLRPRTLTERVDVLERVTESLRDDINAVKEAQLASAEDGGSMLRKLARIEEKTDGQSKYLEDAAAERLKRAGREEEKAEREKEVAEKRRETEEAAAALRAKQVARVGLFASYATAAGVCIGVATAVVKLLGMILAGHG